MAKYRRKSGEVDAVPIMVEDQKDGDYVGRYLVTEWLPSGILPARQYYMSQEDFERHFERVPSNEGVPAIENR